VKNKIYFISNIFVLPAYRKQGIATRLVKKMLQEKCSNGAELLVQVSTDSELKYWENLHFIIKETVLSLKKV
jgi:ribosomal protein S18 acetylase RimI-like enzyme